MAAIAGCLVQRALRRNAAACQKEALCHNDTRLCDVATSAGVEAALPTLPPDWVAFGVELEGTA
jgi:hypothetical protein